MAAKYKNLDIAISADTSKLEKGVQTATKAVQGLDRQVDTARRGTGKFDDQLRRGTGSKSFSKGADQAGRAAAKFDGSLRKTQSELKRTEATAEKSGKGFGTRLTAGVRGSVGKLGVSLRQNLSGKSVLSAAKTGGALAAGAMGLSMLMNLGESLKEGIGQVFEAVGEQAANRADLIEKLGLNKAQAARAGRATGQAYASNFGDSLTTVNDAVKSVIQNIDGMRGASAKTLQYMAQRSITTGEVLDADVGEVTRTISQLLRTGMAKNAKQAFDILTVGAQHGANAAGDLLDTFTEYPTQFRDLGLSGRDAMGLIMQGMKGGARDSDLVADALKELNIRVKSLDTNAVPALKALGLNANAMAEAFSQGGPKARAALQQILSRLAAVKDPAKRAQLSMKLFGTQSEDMAAALGKLDLSKARKQLGDIKGATDKAGNAFSQTASGKIETWKRKIKMAVVDFIGDKVIPALERLDSKAGASKGIQAFLAGFKGKDTSKLPKDLKNIADAGASVRRTLNDLGEWWQKKGSPAFSRASKIFQKDLAPAVKQLRTELNQPGFIAFRNILTKIASVLFTYALPAFARLEALNLGSFLRVLSMLAGLAGSLASAFRLASIGFVKLFGTVLHGAAKAFGWIPGLGPKLKQADAQFAAWGRNTINWLNNAGKSATGFNRRHAAALNAARAAQSRYKAMLAMASVEIKKNGNRLDSNTAAGRRQRTAVQNIVAADRLYIQRLKQSGASNDTVRRAIIRHRDKLRDLTGDTKYGRKIQGYYNSELRKIPKKRRTDITIHGTGSFTVPKSVRKAMQAGLNGILGGIAGGFATGGAVDGPGTATSDSIPARLSTGEHVIPAKEVKAAGGQQAIYALRQQIRGGARVPGYAKGGAVKGTGPNGMWHSNTPYVMGKTAAGYDNVSSAVVAATAATMGQLWAAQVAKLMAGGGGKVMQVARAQIGKPYVWGAAGPNAFDCSGLVQYAYKKGAGMMLPHFDGDQIKHGRAIHSRSALMPGDIVRPHPGHIYLVNTPGAAGSQGIVEAPRTGLNVRATAFRGMGGGARRLIEGLGGSAGGSGKWGSLVARVLSELGLYSPGNLSNVLRAIQKESGGNPRAINRTDINARRGDPSRGLLQTIGSTFNAYAGKYRSRGIYDPYANVYAAIRYAHSRYGAGWSARMAAPGGYDTGGILGPGQVGKNYSKRPERVLSPRQTDAFERLVARLPVTRLGAAAAATVAATGPQQVVNVAVNHVPGYSTEKDVVNAVSSAHRQLRLTRPR